MKYIFITIISCISIPCFGQIPNQDSIKTMQGFHDQNRLDSIINSYERKYRETLNKSDTILINKLINDINKNNSLFDTIINSKNYSNHFLAELTQRLLRADICLNCICDRLSFFHPVYEDNSTENYPILLGSTKSEFDKSIIQKYLIESNYLSDCSFLLNRDMKVLKILSYFLKLKQNQYFNTLETCKNANLVIIKLIDNKK